MAANDKHLDKIREQFTATADAFADFVRVTRGDEAEHLAELAATSLARASQSPADVLADVVAIDVACGPGTFTRPLALRVHHAVGVDLTPAMIEKARAEAARAGITNIEFVCADVYALPFADGTAGIVSCGYAVHHMTDPTRALAEMARVLRPGGRVAIVDMIVPEGADIAVENAIERIRDPSHTNTFTATQFRELFESAGLRVLIEEFHENIHDYDQWMRHAGSLAGDAVYNQTRRMLEETMANDTAGLHPRRSTTGSGFEFVHTILTCVAEKPES